MSPATLASIAMLMLIAAATPAWSQWTLTSCGSCHHYPPLDGTARNVPAGAVMGSHQQHASTSAGNYGFACSVCHVTPATTTSADYKHRNGTIQMQSTFPTYSGSYSKPASFAQTNSPVMGTCSGTYCHSQGTLNNPPYTASNQTATWSATFADTCKACHNAAQAVTPGDATDRMNTNRHLSHIDNSASVGDRIGCQECHAATVSAETTVSTVTLHANKLVNTKFDNVINLNTDNPTFAGSSTTVAAGAARAPGSAVGNCANVYCHSSGNLGSGSNLTFRLASWNTSSTIGCDGCHGDQAGKSHPVYANGGAGNVNANSHPAHVNGGKACDTCHVETTQDTALPPTVVRTDLAPVRHINRAENVTFNTTKAGASAAWVSGTKTCSSLACHGSAQWGGPSMDCVSCHGAALGNRRQVTGAGGDFVRPSRHVSNGTTGEIVTKWDCIVCHLEGNTTGTTSANHTGTPSSNADVNLRNVDNYTTGWVWNRFGTITTAMRDNMDSFCMGCHDSLGATQINVNGTNSGLNLNNTRALTPFNTNDNLRGNTADAGTLGTFRSTTYGRVLNVKDQFNSTNQTGPNWASHHNLNQFTKRYGTRNTTYFPNSLFVNVTLKEGNLQTLGETIGLHCSDCHLNEANAHGALNSRFMLQDSSGGDTNWSGASATDGGTHVCYKCHATTPYDEASTTGRFDHSQDASRTLNIVTSPLGIICFNCHGGYSSGTQGALGAIHGTNETYVPGGATLTTKRYRFMSGSVMRFYRPAPTGTTNITDANWTSTSTANSCYTVAGDDTWSAGCSQHSGGRAMGANSINYQKQLQW